MSNGDLLTRLKDATYLGSHPARPGQQEKVVVGFYRGGIRADGKRGQALMRLEWSEVHDLDASTQQDYSSRVTTTRLATLGFLAIAIPKRTVVSFLIIADSTAEWVFAVPGLSAVALRSGLAPLRTMLPNRAPSLPVAVVSDAGPAERLRRLDELLEQGLITQAELATRRTAIIDSL
jgi:hypothetical protein